MTIRKPAVAGSFYQDDPERLKSELESYFEQAKNYPSPKAIIAPHAGTIYSGPIAASAYASLGEVRDLITKVVILGPAHRFPVRGLAASTAETFETPLGEIPIDEESVQKVIELPQVNYLNEAHTEEHSIEIHLPFLQSVLNYFEIIPLVVGEAEPEEVAEVLEKLWGGPETLIVISSDLSHYLDYNSSRRVDQETSHLIEEFNLEKLKENRACGYHPIRGLLLAARRRKMRCHTVDLRNSGDTAGFKDQVVGYGAYLFYELKNP